MIEFYNLPIEELEKIRIAKTLELQELDAEFTASRIDASKHNRSKIEKLEDEEWRVQAVEDKKNICNELRIIKSAIKDKNTQSGANLSSGEAFKQMLVKLDTIIELMRDLK